MNPITYFYRDIGYFYNIISNINFLLFATFYFLVADKCFPPKIKLLLIKAKCFFIRPQSGYKFWSRSNLFYNLYNQDEV